MTYFTDSNDFRELFDDAPVAYHELDEQGTIRRVNKAECQLLGFAAEEMIGRPIWEFVAGEEAAASRIAVSEKLTGNRPLTPFCRTYVTRDGRYRMVEVRDRLIRNADGEVVGIRSALIDITERLATEHTLTESRDWMAAVLRSLADGIIAIDPLGQIVSMNPAAESILSLSEPEVVGAAFEARLSIADFQIGEQYAPTFASVFTRSLREPWSGTAAVTTRNRGTSRLAIGSSPIMTGAHQVVGFALTLCRHNPVLAALDADDQVRLLEAVRK